MSPTFVSNNTQSKQVEGRHGAIAIAQSLLERWWMADVRIDAGGHSHLVGAQTFPVSPHFVLQTIVQDLDTLHLSTA